MSYTKKNYDEIKTNMVLNIVSNISEINDVNTGSVLDLFTSAIAIEIAQQYNDCELIYNSTRISTATGDDLDELGLLLGVERNDGSIAQGKVTFIRQQESTSDFVIPANSEVSTLPNSYEPTYNYKTINDITFKANISDEEHKFIDGVFEYKLDSNIIGSIQQVRGIVGGSSNTFTQGTDYNLIKKYNSKIEILDNYELVDSCDSTTGWILEGDASSITNNVSNKIQGSSSLNLEKNGTTNGFAGYYKSLSSPIDISNLDLVLRLFISSGIVYNNFDTVKIFLGNNNSFNDCYYKEFKKQDLKENIFNLLNININDPLIRKIGSPDSSSINIIKIIYVSTSTTIYSNQIVMDFWHLSKIQNWEGDVLQFDKNNTIPDNNTNFYVDYKPLSVTGDIKALDKGAGYNVAIGKVNHKVSNIPDIDTLYNFEDIKGGKDIENDLDFKDRIQHASALKSLASVESIKYNVLELDFVKHCKVIDIPEQTQTNELHTYISGINKYTLSKEVAQDNDNLIVTTYDTTLNGNINDSQTTITLLDATNFKNSGNVIIENEIITYTGKSGNDLTGCSRGAYGTNASLHSDGVAVKQIYIRNTDYYLTNLNEIDFSLSGDEPNNNDVMHIDYYYNWLGHFFVLVIGESGLLTTSQINEVTNLVEEVKSAGVISHIYQPTIKNINVTITLTIDNDYDYTEVKNNVSDNIRNYINNLDIAEDVLVAGLIKTIMSVEGTLNVVINDIGGLGNNDYIIADDEIAKSSLIIINVN